MRVWDLESLFDRFPAAGSISGGYLTGIKTGDRQLGVWSRSPWSVVHPRKLNANLWKQACPLKTLDCRDLSTSLAGDRSGAVRWYKPVQLAKAATVAATKAPTGANLIDSSLFL